MTLKVTFMFHWLVIDTFFHLIAFQYFYGILIQVADNQVPIIRQGHCHRQSMSLLTLCLQFYVLNFKEKLKTHPYDVLKTV